MGPSVQLFKVQNGEYGGANEPQNPKNLVRPSKKAVEWCPKFTIDVSPSTFCQELKYAKLVLLSHKVLHTSNLWFFTHGVGEKDEGIIGHIFQIFFLTITWPIPVHLTWPRACFNHTREGYKMIRSKTHQTHGLPMDNPNHDGTMVKCMSMNVQFLLLAS